MRYLITVCFMVVISLSALAQEPSGPSNPSVPGQPSNAASQSDNAPVIISPDQASLLPSGQAQAIILSTVSPKPPAFLYSVKAHSDIKVSNKGIDQVIKLDIRVIQGKGETVSLGIMGTGDVVDVQGEGIKSWAIRTANDQRYLDLLVANDEKEKIATVRIKSTLGQLPTQVEIAHLSAGSSLGFDSQIEIKFSDSVAGRIVDAAGFAPLISTQQATRLQTSTGGKLTLRLDRLSSLPPVVELIDTEITGKVDSSGKSIDFSLKTNAVVQEAGAKLRIISGGVGLSNLPESSDYRIELVATDAGPAYEVVFSKTGKHIIALDFVAAIKQSSTGTSSVNFAVAGGAVVPLRLQGLGGEIEFGSDQQSIIPLRVEQQWIGFLPGSGQVSLAWRNLQSSAGESKAFFTTNSTVETSVGPGLLRQLHRINYQMLQGQTRSLKIAIHGPGEIVSVEGANIVAWKVSGEGEQRMLDVSLSQPINSSSQYLVRSQSAVGEFPVRIGALTLRPQGAIRSSGFLRLSNSGSVRVEATALRGLGQLAAEQFPGDKIEAKQVFAYRFPSDDYDYAIVADQIEPEISVTHLVVYQLSETDRVISAEIELDIREATIRQWNVLVPEDYSVVAVSGKSVADFLVASEVNSGRRSLKVLFSDEIQGRQLISLRLEKNQPAETGAWELPALQFPEAKTLRGDVGVVAAAGLRTTVSKSESLLEKPLAYFPKSIANLQQAFRIREPGWSVVLQIQQIERSIQSDMLHLYSLSHGTIYGSALVNYSVTGAPVSEWKLSVPAGLANVTVDGPEIRSWRRDGDVLVVSLHRPVMGAYTLLVTFEEKPSGSEGSFQAGLVTPIDVQSDRGFVQVVSPVQVDMQTQLASSQLLMLDPLELPAEFRLLTTAPSLGTWQYTQRPFELRLKVNWFEPGATAAQVVEFSEANSRVSQDGELVTDVLYYVKTRGQKALKVRLPGEPVRLWAASVAGRPVTARQAGEDTLIPLPGEADPNQPVEVSLRLGKAASSKSSAQLQLPVVFAPVLKTQWNVVGDENHILIPNGGSVGPSKPLRWPNGFDFLANRGLIPLAALGVLSLLAALLHQPQLRIGLLLLAIVVAIFAAIYSYDHMGRRLPLQLDLPVMAAGESVDMRVDNIPTWRAFVSWPGVAMIGMGLVILALNAARKYSAMMIWTAALLVAVGLLLQTNGAIGFWCFVVLLIGLLQLFPEFSELIKRERQANQAKLDSQKSAAEQLSDSSNGGSGVLTSTIILLTVAWLQLASSGQVRADERLLGKHNEAAKVDNLELLNTESLRTADSLQQKWDVSLHDNRLKASATITFSGRPGDRILLLRSPAVLTKFEGDGLRLSKLQVENQGIAYAITVPSGQSESALTNDVDKKPDQNSTAETTTADAGSTQIPPQLKKYAATFEYQLDANQPAGIPVLTGSATFQTIDLSYDEPTWQVSCDAAARIELAQVPSSKPDSAQGGEAQNNAQAKDKQPMAEGNSKGRTSAKILLGPNPALIVLKPQTRDLAAEKVQFYVEGAEVYSASPGVIDGKHRFKLRISQGRLQNLTVVIPTGLTVSSVDGPVANWTFDAEQNRLKIQVKPVATLEFALTVETQRSLGALPTPVELQPLRMEGAASDVGLLALAFNSEAQPENIKSESFSTVGLADFDVSLLAKNPATLHRVFRYGMEPGKVTLDVTPVAPEIRVSSKQVISLSDERVVLAANLLAEITRTGVFQLSFALPEGLELETLSGESLHHWSEITENGKRKVIMHLKGKTLGAQKFTITLAGTAPAELASGAQNVNWELPKLEVAESTRQTGELVIQPMTGLRLRTAERQNVSEADPRALGSQAQGALAFRLLQQNWKLQLTVERLAAWVTGQILHDVTLREGQTRVTAFVELNVQNANIRLIRMKLPIGNADIAKTVRAHGEAVSDIGRSSDETQNIWELRFKRRIVGPVRFQIEFERRGDRVGDIESLSPVELIDVQQIDSFFAVRSGGRLEIETGALSQGWQPSDWSSIPQSLRDAGNRSAPALALRSNQPPAALGLRVTRHSLAEALKLRVASGTLTTVLSQTGDQLTEVDVSMEVIQRSSLSLQLPEGAELLSIFVNGESTHTIRQDKGKNVWQFYVLPGIDDRTAQVRFAYSLIGSGFAKANLTSPLLNVPLENIQWHVIVPSGMELIDNDGSLELVNQQQRGSYDRNAYLASVRGKRLDQAKQATQLLEQANRFLQSGQRSKAHWALNNVANRYALDAASNEDARVQLENLQMQQAIVGLNSRRQRLLLDSSRSEVIEENEQKRQAAASNPILLQDQLNYRPQELSSLLAGNSKEDNATLQQIAARLVLHQRTTEPAPQAIVFSVPEEGKAYSFRRAVQVTENSALKLQLKLHSLYSLRVWQWVALAGLLGLVILCTGYRRSTPVA